MIKTIRITEETHQKLKDAGKKGQTFEDIILRLLEIK